MPPPSPAHTRRTARARHRAPPHQQLVLGTGISGGGIGDGRHLRTGQRARAPCGLGRRECLDALGGLQCRPRRTERRAGRRRQPRRHVAVRAVLLPRAGRHDARTVEPIRFEAGEQPSSAASPRTADRRTSHSPGGDPSTGEVEEAATDSTTNIRSESRPDESWTIIPLDALPRRRRTRRAGDPVVARRHRRRRRSHRRAARGAAGRRHLPLGAPRSRPRRARTTRPATKRPPPSKTRTPAADSTRCWSRSSSAATPRRRRRSRGSRSTRDALDVGGPHLDICRKWIDEGTERATEDFDRFYAEDLPTLSEPSLRDEYLTSTSPTPTSPNVSKRSTTSPRTPSAGTTSSSTGATTSPSRAGHAHPRALREPRHEPRDQRLRADRSGRDRARRVHAGDERQRRQLDAVRRQPRDPRGRAAEARQHRAQGEHHDARRCDRPRRRGVRPRRALHGRTSARPTTSAMADWPLGSVRAYYDVVPMLNPMV